ncbi:MAG: DUF4430 domain-containing protein [Candidatus Odinarchaeota archaeon]
MNKQQTNFLTALLLILSLGLASTTTYFYFQSEQYKNSYNNLVGETIRINIGIDYANGTVEWHNNTLAPKNITALQATILVAEVNYTMYSFGPFVTGINGVEAAGTMYWALYYNGEYSMIGAGDLYLLFGDTVKWVFESWA